MRTALTMVALALGAHFFRGGRLVLVAVSLALDSGLWISWVRDSLWATASGAAQVRASRAIRMWSAGSRAGS